MIQSKPDLYSGIWEREGGKEKKIPLSFFPPLKQIIPRGAVSDLLLNY